MGARSDIPAMEILDVFAARIFRCGHLELQRTSARSLPFRANTVRLDYGR